MLQAGLGSVSRSRTNMFPEKFMGESDNVRELWTLIASLMAVLALCKGMLAPLFPLLSGLNRFVTKLVRLYSSYCYFDINEIQNNNANELYNDVQLYLSSKLLVVEAGDKSKTSRLTLTRTLNSSNINFSLSSNDDIIDTYNNVTLHWQHFTHSSPTNSSYRRSSDSSEREITDEQRFFTLRFRKKDRALVLDSYIDYITRTTADIRRKNEDRLLYTNGDNRGCDFYRSGKPKSYPWHSVPFKHPSTFDTLAMDPDKKEEILNDLKDFANNGQSFYQKTGRAWKRGYLLYGPPGTGKSSMIAAMVNFLGYDVYDLELTTVTTNTQLRKLLMKTESKSIIVIEDIDCSVKFDNRKFDNNDDISNAEREAREENARRKYGTEITLSGLLNFIDGLWSCCGSERIFVFTTNYVEKLDPALLRSGRMDMHILMDYCSFESLKILLKNYLDYSEDDLLQQELDELEGLVEKAKMTPADVSEYLIKHKRDKAKAVQELIRAMQLKAEENMRAQANGTSPS